MNNPNRFFYPSRCIWCGQDFYQFYCEVCKQKKTDFCHSCHQKGRIHKNNLKVRIKTV